MPKNAKRVSNAFPFLTILGKQIKIEIIKDLEEFGHFDSNNWRIQIRKGLSEEEYNSTLLHETIHASLFIGGISELLTEEMEEAICRNLEHLPFFIIPTKTKDS